MRLCRLTHEGLHQGHRSLPNDIYTYIYIYIYQYPTFLTSSMWSHMPGGGPASSAASSITFSCLLALQHCHSPRQGLPPR